MKKRIYAYYESLQERPQVEEFACANAWKRSWEAQGWECIMLNGSHAKNSSLYYKLVKKLVSIVPHLPPEAASSISKNMARYKRWCALHASGGGWMSDYDVANIAFTPTVAEEFEKTGTIHVVTCEPAYLFYATPSHCNAAISKFISEDMHRDGVMLFESEILGVEDTINAVAELLFHGECNQKTAKSKQMLEYCT